MPNPGTRTAGERDQGEVKSLGAPISKPDPRSMVANSCDIGYPVSAVVMGRPRLASLLIALNRRYAVPVPASPSPECRRRADDGHRRLFRDRAWRCLPLVAPGADLAAIISRRLRIGGWRLGDGDVIVLAQKIVSKAEGRSVALADVEPSGASDRAAQQCAKDPRRSSWSCPSDRGDAGAGRRDHRAHRLGLVWPMPDRPVEIDMRRAARAVVAASTPTRPAPQSDDMQERTGRPVAC